MADDIAAALALADSRDRREIRRAWSTIRVSVEIVPAIATAYAATRSAAARAYQIYQVTPFARFDAATVELGLRALADRAAEVRTRACGLLAQSRRRDVLPSLRKLKSPPARRAIATITDGKPFAPDGDPFWFFDLRERGRAPWGGFADAVDGEIGPWMAAQGFRPTWLFSHTAAWERGDLSASATWENWEVEAMLEVERGGQRVGRTILSMNDGVSRRQIADALRELVSRAL